MNQQEYMSQTSSMVIPHLPKYIFMVSMMTDEETREKNLILSFSLAPAEILGPEVLSPNEQVSLAMKSEILGQLAISEDMLKDVLKKMKYYK